MSHWLAVLAQTGVNNDTAVPLSWIIGICAFVFTTSLTAMGAWMNGIAKDIKSVAEAVNRIDKEQGRQGEAIASLKEHKDRNIEQSARLTAEVAELRGGRRK